MIAFFHRFIPTKKPTKLELAIIVVIVVVLIALLLPSVQGVWDGDRVLPVLVEVYDASTGHPIVGARVMIFRHQMPSVGDRVHLEADSHEWMWDNSKHGITDAEGLVRLEHKFDASGKHDGRKSISAWLFLYKARVCVTANSYGGVIVPVRYEATPLKVFNSEGRWRDVYVTVGLFPHGAARAEPD